MKSKKPSPSSNPWASMEQLFNGAFPFSESSLTTHLTMTPEWVERAVQQALTPSTLDQSKELYTHTQFETHKSVIIRIKLPNSINPELLRVYVGATSLRVEGFPNQAEKKVRLPCEVSMTGIRSTYDDEILEIRMLKKRSSEQERQINITIL